MYKKFVINDSGVLKFGIVSRHMDLLEPGQSDCFGGGLWEIDKTNHSIMLFSRSFDFGAPDFSKLKRIDWDTLDGQEHLLIYYPSWPDQVLAVPIII